MDMIPVVPFVSGTIMEYPIKSGMQINKGDLIAKIDDEPYKQQMLQAKAAYLGYQSTFERVENLYKANAATQQNYDSAKAQRDAAKAQYDLAILQMSKNDEVFILATCNELYNLPSSLIRAGRFDKVVKINEPKGEDAINIVTHYLNKKKNVGNVDAKEIAKILLPKSSGFQRGVKRSKTDFNKMTYSGATFYICNLLLIFI